MKDDCCVLCVSAARQSIALAISLGVRPRPARFKAADKKQLCQSEPPRWEAVNPSTPAEPWKVYLHKFVFFFHKHFKTVSEDGVKKKKKKPTIFPPSSHISLPLNPVASIWIGAAKCAFCNNDGFEIWSQIAKFTSEPRCDIYGKHDNSNGNTVDSERQIQPTIWLGRNVDLWPATGKYLSAFAPRFLKTPLKEPR